MGLEMALAPLKWLWGKVRGRPTATATAADDGVATAIGGTGDHANLQITTGITPAGTEALLNKLIDGLLEQKSTGASTENVALNSMTGASVGPVASQPTRSHQESSNAGAHEILIREHAGIWGRIDAAVTLASTYRSGEIRDPISEDDFVSEFFRLAPIDSWWFERMTTVSDMYAEGRGLPADYAFDFEEDDRFEKIVLRVSSEREQDGPFNPDPLVRAVIFGVLLETAIGAAVVGHWSTVFESTLDRAASG